MMPDLGKYAVWVLSAYGVSLTLLALVVLASLWQARRTLDKLRRMEEGRVAARGGPERGEPEPRDMSVQVAAAASGERANG
ncbi:MAG: heme exporter protein CcmD [Pseudomonadota bacterium]